MRRLALLVSCVVGCAPPPAPPVMAIPPAEPVAAAAPPPEEAAPQPDARPAPALPLHRFAALVPGEPAALFPVAGRLLLRAGQRLFSLSPGRVRREAALEKALADRAGKLDFGVIGGRYPDRLVAERAIPGKDAPFRQYLRIDHGKVTQIARLQQSIAEIGFSHTLQIALLPGDRVLALFEMDAGGDHPYGWLRFVPRVASDVEDEIEGAEAHAAYPFPLLLSRADGSTVVVRVAVDGIGSNQALPRTLRLISWAEGRAPVNAALELAEGEGPQRLFETTAGVLSLVTNQGLHEEVGGAWRRVDAGAPIRDAWPLPDGAALLVTEEGEPLVRDAKGAVSRARWPLDEIEGRRFAVRFDAALCTREAGFWAIAKNGMGLYHDGAPGQVLDITKVPPEP